MVCCTVLCWLCCAVLCCAVLCCAVLCCAVVLLCSNIFSTSGSLCVMPLTDLERLATGYFVPLIGIGLLAINLALHYVLWRVSHKPQALPACIAEREWMKDLRDTDSFELIVRRYRRTLLALFVAFCTVPPRPSLFLSAVPF
jgi:hypothetical protein